MPHKRVHSLAFSPEGRNELAGLVEAVSHGPSLMDITMTFDPVEMQKVEEEEKEPHIIHILMSRDAWKALEANLVKNKDGKLTALAVNRPNQFTLEVLPPPPPVNH
jgi:hypothetical protein